MKLHFLAFLFTFNLCFSRGLAWTKMQYSNVFVGTSWQSNMHWCWGASQQVYVADFNGDRQADMLCHDSATGNVWIAYAPGFGRRWWRNAWWCYGRGTSNTLFIGDFNGDNRSDLLCHSYKNGYKWIAFADANGHFGQTVWHKNMGWCWGDKARLYVVDFNGDSRDDLLCHLTTTGYKWISINQLM